MSTLLVSDIKIAFKKDKVPQVAQPASLAYYPALAVA